MELGWEGAVSEESSVDEMGETSWVNKDNMRKP
jgi:hypothetical protein